MADNSSSRDAIVIGAGMIGVCSAWHLQRRGFKVTVVDRKDPGEETSWGNAGLIQRECVLPYSFPQSWKDRVSIALHLRQNMHYDPWSLAKYWYPIFEYWRCSIPRNYDILSRQFATLVAHCTEEHEALFKVAGSSNLVRKGGFIEVFRTKTLPQIEALTEDYRSRGVRLEVLTPADIKQREPSIDTTPFSGGVVFLDAWRVVDPGGLVKSYAKSFTGMGGKIVKASVEGVSAPSSDGSAKWVVHTDAGDLTASNVVVAAGPWSADFMQKLGCYFPLFPLRGYNMHFQALNGATINTGFMDVENGCVLSHMVHGVRLTTGGELTAISNSPHEGIIDACAAQVRQYFPLGERVSKVWYGTRPCMPDMKPVIGPCAKLPGLWVNFGHAHSGFTLGPVSGRLLAELMNNEKPLVDPTPFDPNRF